MNIKNTKMHHLGNSIFFWCACLLILFTGGLDAQSLNDDYALTLPSPSAAGLTNAAWLQAITNYRNAQITGMKYNGQNYAQSALLWTQSSYIQPQMMIQDRFFYDPLNHHIRSKNI